MTLGPSRDNKFEIEVWKEVGLEMFQVLVVVVLHGKERGGRRWPWVDEDSREGRTEATVRVKEGGGF